MPYAIKTSSSSPLVSAACLLLVSWLSTGVVHAQNVQFNTTLQTAVKFDGNGVATGVENFEVVDSTGITTGPVSVLLVYSSAPVALGSTASWYEVASVSLPYLNCSTAYLVAGGGCTWSEWSFSGTPPPDGTYYVGLYALEADPPGGCVTGFTVRSGSFEGQCIDAALASSGTETVTYTQNVVNTVTDAVGSAGGGCLPAAPHTWQAARQ